MNIETNRAAGAESGRDEFIVLLAGFRRQLFLRRFPGAAADALCIAAAAAVVLVAAIRFGVFGWETLWFPAGMWTILLSALWLHRRPGLMESAQLFDRLADSHSAAANALELTDRNAKGAFAAYAVENAARRLAAWRGPLPPMRSRWKTGSALSAAAALAVFAPLPASFSNHPKEGRQTAPKTATVAERSAELAPILNVPTTLPPRLAALRRSRPTIPESGRTDGFSRSSAASDDGRDGNTAGAGNSRGGGETAGGKPGGENEPEKAPESAEPTGAEGKPSSGGLSGNSGANGEEDGRLRTEMSAGSSGGDRSLSRRNRNRKEVRKKEQEARGGVQPLLPDNAPPAGRELSEKEGEGDRPGDGRGGDTGEKKSRGAASALPVIPLPDTVTGRLGAGEDITSAERAPAGNGAAALPGAPGATVAVEPPLPRTGASAALRRIFRTIADGEQED